MKVIWSREEDMQHDIDRPATLHKITAGIDARGQLKAISHQLASPAILMSIPQPSPTITTRAAWKVCSKAGLIRRCGCGIGRRKLGHGAIVAERTVVQLRNVWRQRPSDSEC